MRVDKLHLQDFGKFHNKDISLAPGLNIIYGPNEAGKTTTKDFIVDMFYGIDKSRGLGGRFDHYEKRKPINGSAYSGAMEFTTEAGQYYMERNFSRQEKSTTVRDLNSGREMELVDAHNIVGTIMQTDKATYMNTLCMSQMGAATDKEIVDKLNHYIVNMASSKTGEIDTIGAVEKLEEKKKEFSNKELETREQELTKSLILDRDYDAEIAALQKEYKKAEEAAAGKEKEELKFTPIKNRANEENTDDRAEENAMPATKREKDLQMLRNMGPQSILDNVMVTLFIALLAIALFIGIAYAVPVNSPSVKMVIIGGGIIFVALMLIFYFSRRSQLYKLLEEIEIEQGFEEAKEQNAGVNQRLMLEKMSDIKVKEQQIAKERLEQEGIMKEINSIKEKIASNEIELAALDLAIDTIQELSEEIYDSFGSVLNTHVSEIISKITQGKYSDVRIDDQLRVMVKSGTSYISMDYLSAGTIEQIYLALRLSLARVLVKDNMPIILEDIFVNYDYQRLKEAINCLQEYMDHQIIIFTANPGIQDMFTEIGVSSNYISL